MQTFCKMLYFENIMINEELLEKIKIMAASPDWKIKEEAANEIKRINDKYFPEYLPVWENWIKDSNPDIRRAVEVGLLRIKKEYSSDALKLLKVLIYDSDPYVRKNCGPFALSSIGYRSPELTFHILNKWIKINNKNVRWNIAMSLGARFGQYNTNEAIKLLKTLAGDREKFVWRAATSSLIKLLRRHPDLKNEILAWENCENCLNVINKYI
jgi:HEAT repeat protein